MQITVAANSSSFESAPSPALPVTIDKQGPRITGVNVDSFAAGGSTGYAMPAEEMSPVQLHPVRLTNGLDRVTVIFEAGSQLFMTPGAVRLHAVDAGTDLTITATVNQFVPHVLNVLPNTTVGKARLWLLIEAAGLVDLAGNPIDGDWTSPTSFTDTSGNSQFPSGNGGMGSNFEFAMTVLLADTNNDGLVNIDDLNNVRNNFGCQAVPPNTCVGDTDFDNDVDIDDLNNVRNNFGLDWSVFPPPPIGMFSAPIVQATGDVGLADVSASDGTRAPEIGIEAMRAALVDYFHGRNSDLSSPGPYDDLIGWGLLGDDEWWDALLGLDSPSVG